MLHVRLKKKKPPLKLRVFADDITALLMRKMKEVAEMTKKVMRKLKEEVEKKGLKLSVADEGKKSKSNMIASCGYLRGTSCVNAARKKE